MPGRNTNWLQGQDSNLRYRGYEPRGLDRTCPPCEKKARRTVKVRQSGASWRGNKQSRAWGKGSCGLLGRSWSRNIRGPGHAIGPILREPQHRLFERAGVQIAVAIGDAVKRRASIQNNRRQPLAANAARLSKDIGDRYELFSKRHGRRKCGLDSALSRDFVPHDFSTTRGYNSAHG